MWGDIINGKTTDEIADEIYSIVAGVKHRELSHAFFADVFDIIPIVGDISNVIRTAEETDESQRARQAVDILVGSLPDPIGGFLDFLTPTNTIKFIIEKGGLEWKAKR